MAPFDATHMPAGGLFLTDQSSGKQRKEIQWAVILPSGVFFSYTISMIALYTPNQNNGGIK